MSTDRMKPSDPEPVSEDWVPVPAGPYQLGRTADGRYRIFADGRGALVVNASAAIAWGHFDGERPIDEIAAIIRSQLAPDVPLQALTEDVCAIAADLRDQGYIHLAPPGAYPDFLIIGAPKCGTTSLIHNLRRHPDVHTPGREMHFFENDRNWRLGTAWYRGHFPETHLLQGEKTPDYLASEVALERLESLVPDARLIVLLRDPVARTYSQWNHFNEIADTSTAWGWIVCDFESSLERNPSLLRKGRYAEQLERLFRHFPRASVHIGITERFHQDAHGEFARVCDFLGISRVAQPYARANARTYPAPMAEETRCRLVEYYRPLNERLFELLGERITEWDCGM